MTLWREEYEFVIFITSTDSETTTKQHSHLKCSKENSIIFLVEIRVWKIAIMESVDKKLWKTYIFIQTGSFVEKLNA